MGEHPLVVDVSSVDGRYIGIGSRRVRIIFQCETQILL